MDYIEFFMNVEKKTLEVMEFVAEKMVKEELRSYCYN